jgi:CDK-activating kinase assembly factor MAT1
MCESCVDRIFAMGPAPCPYPGCGKTLRKNKFKTQIFDDIGVEREVDVRKRVSTVFNKTQKDFDDLDQFNKYLEEVEDIVFNLVNCVDVETTEMRLKEYEESNKSNIEENNAKRLQEIEDFKKEEERKNDLKMKKTILERQLAQEQKELREIEKKEILNNLATSDGDANQKISQVKKSFLKKSSARRKELDAVMLQLNERQANEKEQKHNIPFTPFNGDRVLTKQYHVCDSYYDPFIDELKNNREYIASGFKAEHVYDRVLTEAFTGLGCFIEKEKQHSVPLES